MLADLESLEKRVDNLSKKAKGNDKEAREQLDLVNRALVLLREGKPARLLERKPEEERAFGMLGLLTSKPVLYVCNVEEASAARGNEFSRLVAEQAKKEGAVAVTISAKIESEIATLSRGERAEFLDTLGLEEAGLDRLIRAGYQLLDLITYFTVGPKEARAWTIHRGTKAPAAAGVIHTDFEKGFIRAETIAYADYVALGRARPAPAMPASCGWKARTTSSPTATSCISGLILEVPPSLRGAKANEAIQSSSLTMDCFASLAMTWKCSNAPPPDHGWRRGAH